LIAVTGTLSDAREATGQHLLWYALVCGLVLAMRVASEALVARDSETLTRELRMNLARQVVSLPLRTQEEMGSHRILAIFTDDIPNLVRPISTMPAVYSSAVVALACIGYMAFLSWRVLLGTAGFIALSLLSVQLTMRFASRYLDVARRAQDSLFEHLRGLGTGAKELKLNRKRRHEFVSRVLHDTALSLEKNNIQSRVLFGVASTWGQTLLFLLLGLVAVLGQQTHQLAGAPLASFILLVTFLISPLVLIMNTLPDLARANTAMKALEGLHLSPAAVMMPELAEHGSAPSNLGWNRLELVDVTHRFDGPTEHEQFAIGPIRLEFRSGETVFITGGNGSGKTTLVKVLSGLYPPENGKILVDGRAVEEGARDEYRQLFSAVFFDFHLFDRLLGMSGSPSRERIAGLLKRLALDRKVNVGEDLLVNTDLSQGQKRRLALLGALLEDRPIYVFDEWASDQDREFREFFYLELLPELKARGKTVLVVSHDDRYYHVADRVIKLEWGLVVEDKMRRLERELPAMQLGTGVA
jgi:putative ATP-binding cassette transporter